MIILLAYANNVKAKHLVGIFDACGKADIILPIKATEAAAMGSSAAA